MIDSQSTTRSQESNSSLSAFTFFLSLRLHHQMWFSNLNNQKGLVTSSQNTFCKFKLRDKARAHSPKRKQPSCKQEVSKKQPGTACKQGQTSLIIKATRVEVSTNDNDRITHKQETRHNIDKQDSIANPLYSHFFLTLGNCTEYQSKVKSFHPKVENQSETLSNVQITDLTE